MPAKVDPASGMSVTPEDATVRERDATRCYLCSQRRAARFDGAHRAQDLCTVVGCSGCGGGADGCGLIGSGLTGGAGAGDGAVGAGAPGAGWFGGGACVGGAMLGPWAGVFPLSSTSRVISHGTVGCATWLVPGADTLDVTV
jgi:hypothetical protein